MKNKIDYMLLFYICIYNFIILIFLFLLGISAHSISMVLVKLFFKNRIKPKRKKRDDTLLFEYIITIRFIFKHKHINEKS